LDEKVGASFANYETPTNCTKTVPTNYATVALAIADIAQIPNGSTICVDKGTYGEFTVNRPLTIVGLHSPDDSVNAAVITPSSAGITELAYVTSSDVTIKGLKFSGNGTTSTGSQMAGIQISPTSSNIDNVKIDSNIITNLTVTTDEASNKGIQWYVVGSTYALTNSAFTNNLIDGIYASTNGGYGIQTVGPMSSVAMSGNTIKDTHGSGTWGAGIAMDLKSVPTLLAMSGVSVTHNQIMDSVIGVAVQVENGIDAANIIVNQNNLTKLLHGGGNPVLGTEGFLNARNNWWGTATPVLGTDVFVSPGETVDFTSPAAAAFTLN
jgi:hypothetical protein